jgi:hypothetical protein
MTGTIILCFGGKRSPGEAFAGRLLNIILGRKKAGKARKHQGFSSRAQIDATAVNLTPKISAFLQNKCC